MREREREREGERERERDSTTLGIAHRTKICHTLDVTIILEHSNPCSIESLSSA